jgi:hypothetical protein
MMDLICWLRGAPWPALVAYVILGAIMCLQITGITLDIISDIRSGDWRDWLDE